MNRCPYCGELFIGSRDGIGVHLSAIWVGLIAGLATAGAMYLVMDLLR